ncbi:MAG TPA: TonB-dependent receptor [Gemmatimonadaceae bacterium]|nr:TonB-dependent receptor [Gemmatimonadaceae bacterium]
MAVGTTLRRCGLGLLVGAILQGTVLAQGTTRDTSATRRDTTRRAPVSAPRDTTHRDTSAVRDTTARRDTTAGAAHAPSDTTASDTTKVPKDTIKAPLAHAPVPRLIGIGEQYHWTRDSMFATGAFNLIGLLELVPGVTVFRSGWLSSPSQAAYLGDPSRVRIFYDGMEVDPLHAQNGGVLDLDAVSLWTLEDVTIERGADELRVYLRSWRVDRTTPSSRVDIVSGDLNTNLYRAFYGKRFQHGEALQLGLEQFGTTGGTFTGGGDQLSLLARLGWAHGPWSIDAFANRTTGTRDQQQALVGSGLIPSLDFRRTNAYVRAGYGDPDKGPWAQLMVVSQEFDNNTSFDSATTPPPALQRTTTETQYVASAGVTLGAFRFGVDSRTHDFEHSTLKTFTERASVESGLVSLSLAAEQRWPDTSSTESATLKFAPLSFLALTGTVTHRHGGEVAPGVRNSIDARAELGIRVHRAWLSAGLMRRGGVTVPGLPVYDPSYVAMLAQPATGIFGTIRGPIYKDLGVDITGIRWSAPGYYRPQYQSRVELYLRTNWLSRVPRNNFGFMGSVAYEYRSSTLFPTAGGTEVVGPASAVALYSHTITPRIEVRIIDATLFIQQFFTIFPPRMAYVPGFILPRQQVMYGVRWHFWN